MPTTGSQSRHAERRRQVRVTALMTVAVLACGGLAYAAVEHAKPPVNTRVDVLAPLPSPSAVAPASRLVAALASVAASGRKPVVSTLGSSLTLGNGATQYRFIWAYRVEQAADALGLRAEWHINGYHGHTIQQIIDAGGIPKVAAQRPDVILLEAGAVNDYGQNTPVVTAVKSLAECITRLRAAVPAATIIFQTGNPTSGDNVKNAVGATLIEYEDAELTWARAHGADTFDLYRAFSGSLAEKPLTTYLRDGVHPNDAGNALWARLFEQHYGLPTG